MYDGNIQKIKSRKFTKVLLVILYYTVDLTRDLDVNYF